VENAEEEAVAKTRETEQSVMMPTLMNAHLIPLTERSFSVERDSVHAMECASILIITSVNQEELLRNQLDTFLQSTLNKLQELPIKIHLLRLKMPVETPAMDLYVLQEDVELDLAVMIEEWDQFVSRKALTFVQRTTLENSNFVEKDLDLAMVLASMHPFTSATAAVSPLKTRGMDPKVGDFLSPFQFV